MKKVLFALLISVLGFSQDKLILTQNGFEPVVTEIPSKSANELYLKTKEWIQKSYKSPNEVLKADLENNLVRIEGYCSDCYQQKALGITNVFGCLYTLEIEFKEGRYRYTYNVTKQYNQGKIVFYTWRDYFKKTGELKNAYKSSFDGMNASANLIYNSLLDYLTGKTDLKKNDW